MVYGVSTDRDSAPTVDVRTLSSKDQTPTSDVKEKRKQRLSDTCSILHTSTVSVDDESRLLGKNL